MGWNADVKDDVSENSTNGMKCADLVRRSTMTQMVSCSFEVLGSFVTKFIVILFHFHIGISGCTSKSDGFWHSALTLKHVKHLPTYSAMMAFMQLLRNFPFQDDSESHNHNLQAILTNDVASCSIPSDEEYVEGLCDQ
nr:hypothetical protein [Tanacetum cinerariifolium]